MPGVNGAVQIESNGNCQSLGVPQLTTITNSARGTLGDILIIEDHAMVLGVLQASLRRHCPHLEQVCVNDAQSALQIISRQWFRVFVDPDSTGAAEDRLVQELLDLGLAQRCCLITTRPRQRMKRQLQGLKGLACISTRIPIEQFHEVLAQTALGITPPKVDLRANPVPRLTARHVELLRLVQRGLQNKAIAHTLGIAEGTVRNHLHSVMKRMGVHNRMQAAQEAARFGIG